MHGDDNILKWKENNVTITNRGSAERLVSSLHAAVGMQTHCLFTLIVVDIWTAQWTNNPLLTFPIIFSRCVHLRRVRLDDQLRESGGRTPRNNYFNLFPPPGSPHDITLQPKDLQYSPKRMLEDVFVIAVLENTLATTWLVRCLGTSHLNALFYSWQTLWPSRCIHRLWSQYLASLGKRVCCLLYEWSYDLSP